MTDRPNPEIPERHVEFCRDIARLCRKHGMNKLSGSYRPPYQENWGADIQFSWERGRHGEDSDKLFISSTLQVHTKLGPEYD